MNDTLFELKSRSITSQQPEPVGILTKKNAIEEYKKAHLQYLQGKSSLPVDSLQSIVKNAPLRLKAPTDLIKAIIKYCTYTGASTAKEKLIVTITYNGHTARVQVRASSDGDGVLKAMPTNERKRNQGTEAGHPYKVASLEEFLPWYINQVLIKYSPVNILVLPESVL